MKKQRVFRQDYIPLEQEFKFTRGEVATIVKEDKKNVLIEVSNQNYKLPYRDFMILTKRSDL